MTVSAYIVIETWPFPQEASIMAEEGKNVVFNSQDEAEEYANENCHAPVIMEI